ncbi:unnamed protein product [Medioppia subpectinata]|uniref:Uncharacterized protein n=1 Tax=Medioppia subpectinata TaxID=1979941 RepID=A0A7R9LJ63_9ACAR|nr:unnamed protein product [Medioppia subpectinata]CAG2119315.1 unnamed protein product [Medioppia subpectinata]
MTINPVECNIRHVMMGEGFHNYHHTFPWDYKASEYGPLDGFNPATIFINTMAVLGQAYDLRQPSPDMIGERRKRTGDMTNKKLSMVWEMFTALATVLIIISPLLIRLTQPY